MRKLKCTCGICKTCYMREYMRRKALEKKKPPIRKALEYLAGNNGQDDEIKAKEKKVLQRTRKHHGLSRIMFINRVGIPVDLDVYKDGGNIVIRAKLGDRCAPEEPIIYQSLAHLKPRPEGAGS